MTLLNRRNALALLGSSAASLVHSAERPAWERLAERARGQTVYFNAWGGAEPINRYLQWAAAQVQASHGVRVEHVKISDAADVVKRVRGEVAAGQQEGSVDLVWINGENFLSMKREALLYGPLDAQLRNAPLIDRLGKPTTQIDFGEPVQGMEVPWGMAQLTFMVDSKRVPQPPQDIRQLLDFARAHPGRLSYPRPPDFHGATFLKQVLLDLHPDRRALYQPVTAQSLGQASAPLWNYLDALHPALWRNGKQWVQNAASMRQMLGDGELLWALTFNPNDAANEIAAQRLPPSVVSYQFPGGTIANTHFVAIPVNARAKEGALVFADFLLSPLAQARKADISLWGDPTVLALDRLPPAQRAWFQRPPAPGQVLHTAPALPEPHGSWMSALEKEWLQRYGS